MKSDYVSLLSANSLRACAHATPRNYAGAFTRYDMVDSLINVAPQYVHRARSRADISEAVGRATLPAHEQLHSASKDTVI